MTHVVHKLVESYFSSQKREVFSKSVLFKKNKQKPKNPPQLYNRKGPTTFSHQAAGASIFQMQFFHQSITVTTFVHFRKALNSRTFGQLILHLLLLMKEEEFT